MGGLLAGGMADGWLHVLVSHIGGIRCAALFMEVRSHGIQHTQHSDALVYNALSLLRDFSSQHAPFPLYENIPNSQIHVIIYSPTITVYATVHPGNTPNAQPILQLCA